MKHLTPILFILLSCAPSSDTTDPVCYSEARLGFYDPFDKDFTINTWIRKPENIRTLHETLKKYGYRNVFSEDELTSNPCMLWSYINRPCANIIDSLILTYPDIARAPEYYKEFWNRRKREQNDTTVFAVLKEIKLAFNASSPLAQRDELTNDTILNLLRIKYKQPGNTQEATENFEYLRAIGLNQSAYNMLFEWLWYEEINWDEERLKDLLKQDSASCQAEPVIADDTK